MGTQSMLSIVVIIIVIIIMARDRHQSSDIGPLPWNLGP